MNELAARTPAPDPVSREQRKSGWKGVLAFGAAVAIVALAVFSGVNILVPRDRRLMFRASASMKKLLDAILAKQPQSVADFSK